MNKLQIAQAISSRFKQQVQDVLDLSMPGKIRFTYDNDPLENPNPPQNSDAAENTIWVHCSVRPGQSQQMTFGAPGSNRFRTPGIMIATIHIPQDSGDKAGLEIADVIEPAFRSLSAGGVTYETPDTASLGNSGPWWQLNVTCPWYSDHFA